MHDAPLVEHEGVPVERLDDAEVLLDEEDRLGLADVLECPCDLRDEQRRESLRRLVDEQDAVVVEERAAQRAGTLSGGQQQMVAIARALLNDNRILLVDEPTKGLAPFLVTEVARALERVSETETILLVEQNLGVVQALAKHAVVLDQGRVVHAGPAAELLGNPTLLRQLLGVSRAAEAA